jgi:hypothetical protein
MALTQYLKDRPIPAMQAGAKRDPPVGSRLNMLVGNSHLFTNLKALDNKLQVRSGKTRTTTTTNSIPMKKPQVATREDACPTLSGGIMINKWTTNASTTN